MKNNLGLNVISYQISSADHFEIIENISADHFEIIENISNDDDVLTKERNEFSGINNFFN